MAATVTYNGVALTTVGKIALGTSDRDLSFSCEFVMTPAELEAARTDLREYDGVLAIAAGSWSTTFSVASNAVQIIPTLEKLGHVLDSNGRKRLRLTVTGVLRTTRSNGFREWFMSADVDPRGLKVVTISGEVSGSDAMATYLAGIDAIQSTAEAIFDAADYEPPQDSFSNAYQNGTILQFQRTITERLEAANNSSTFDPTIIWDRWEVTREIDTDRGNLDAAVRRYRCNWTAMFPKAKADFVSQWDSVIRQLVHTRLKSSVMFTEGRALVIRDDSIQYGTSKQEASGSWVVEAASGTMVYSEKVSVKLTHLAEPEKILNGEDFLEAIFSPGKRARIRQDVAHEMRGVIPPTPQAPVVIVDGKSLELACVYQDWDQENRWRGRVAADLKVSSDHIQAYVAEFVPVGLGAAGRTAVREAPAKNSQRATAGGASTIRP